MNTRHLPLAMLSLALGAGACNPEQNENEFFYIYQNQVPEKGCLITADDEVYRPSGLLDVSLGKGYRLFPLLRNDLPTKKPAGEITDRPDPNMLDMRRFDVEVQLADAAISPDRLEFSQKTSGVLLPDDRRASIVEILPGDLARELQASSIEELTVKVTAIAETGLKNPLRSIPFIYPLRLCNGCLVTVIDNCADAVDIAAGVSGNVCGIPQDGPLLCCNDANRGTVCFATDE